MAHKDIEVRIKARDEASRAAKKVADALKNLGDSGNNLGATGSKVSGALSSMAKDLSNLLTKTGNLDTFGKLVGQVDKAVASISRLEDELKQGRDYLAKSEGATEAAAQATANLKTQIDNEVKAQQARADRIKQLTDRHNEETKAIHDKAKAAKALQTALNGGKGGFSGPRYPSKGVNVEGFGSNKSARESYAVFEAAEIEAGLGGKAALQAEVAALKSANEQSRNSLKSLRQAFAEAKAEQDRFGTDSAKAAERVAKLEAALEAAEATFIEVDSEAESLRKELGGLSMSQEAVADATAKANAELEKQVAAVKAMARYSDGAGGVASPKQAAALRAQNAAIADARSEWKALEDETKRLAMELKGASGDVTELYNKFKQTAAASALAKEEFEKQRAILATLQGSVQGTFGQWAAVYAPIVSGAKQATAAQSAQADASKKTVENLKEIAPQQQRNAKAAKENADATERAAQSTKLFANNTRTTLSLMQRMRGELLAMTSGFVGLYAVMDRGQKAMQAFMAVEKAENRLGVAFEGDTAKVAREINYLNTEADRLGFTFASLADGYGKISLAAADANFSVADTRKLFSSLADAGRVNGSSMDEMNGVLRALEQMLNKGKVQAEELRGQLGDRMTGAFKMFADGLGMTTAELDKAMQKGEVYADRATLLKFADRLTEKYGDQVPEAMKTLAASLGTGQRNMEKVNIALARGFVPAVQKALATFDEFVNSAEGQQMFADIGEGAGTLISALVEIAKHMDTIIAVAKVFGAIMVARTFGQASLSAFDFMNKLRGVHTAIVTGSAATENLSRVQMALNGAYAGVNNSLKSYRAHLMTTTAQSVVAAGANRALAAGVGLARVAFVTLGAAVRTAYALLGGPIGIAITAISLGIMAWKSDADKATDAIERHDRAVQALQGAYNAVTDKSGEWYNNIKGLTVTEAKRNLDDLKSAYQNYVNNIENTIGVGMIRRVVSDEMHMAGMSATEKAENQELISLIDKLKEGEITVTEFRAGMDKLAQTAAVEGLRALAAGLIDVTTEADDAGGSMEEIEERIIAAEKVIRELGGETTDLIDRTDNLGEAFDTNKPKVADYTETMQGLMDFIPSLANEMERLEAATKLNKTAWEGLTAAWKNGDYSDMLQMIGLWGQGQLAIEEKFLEGAVSGGNLADKIIGVESGGNARARNPNSSATGAGQFIESTWLSMFKKYFPQYAEGKTNGEILELRNNAEISRQMVELYAKENAAFLKSMGHQIDDASLYLAHFLGPQGANRVLSASAMTPVDQLLGADQINANRSILEGKNAGQVRNWAAEKMGISDRQLAVMQEMNSLEEKAAEKSAEELQATRDRLAELDHELAQQNLINSGKEKQAEIENAIREARAENPNISEAEIEAIREKTAALYELQNAQTQQEIIEERLANLQELRDGLKSQMENAEAAGDSETYAALKLELDEVNVRLQEAIANAIAMWEAIGGEEAEAKIAGLRALSGSIKTASQQLTFMGLTSQQWGQFVGSAVDGVLSGFDSMYQAILNGENAFEAFGQTVLNTLGQILVEIGKAILKMMILNALRSMGVPVPPMMFGHTGGVVGSKAIGSANKVNVGQPSWVGNAFKYHSGGVAGLASDEVSATLKKGEEVITEEDPRHRDNLGGEKSEKQGTRLKQVLAIGDKEIANAMSGGAGEDVIMTQIKRNAPTIRRLLGV